MNAVTINETNEPMLEEPRLLPGDFAIWFFIFAELLVFGIAFISYAVMRVQNLELFNQYQLTLNRELGAANTLRLITASYFVVRAIHAIRIDDVKNCVRWLYASLGAGAGFLLLKSLEYYDKFSEGIRNAMTYTPQTERGKRLHSVITRPFKEETAP